MGCVVLQQPRYCWPFGIKAQHRHTHRNVKYIHKTHHHAQTPPYCRFIGFMLSPTDIMPHMHVSAQSCRVTKSTKFRLNTISRMPNQKKKKTRESKWNTSFRHMGGGDVYGTWLHCASKSFDLIFFFFFLRKFRSLDWLHMLYVRYWWRWQRR